MGVGGPDPCVLLLLGTSGNVWEYFWWPQGLEWSGGQNPKVLRS